MGLRLKGRVPIVVDEQDAARANAADDLLKVCGIDPESGKPTRPKKKRTPSYATKAGRARARREADEMRKTEEWEDVKPAHLVAVYAWCHERVYGVEPLELNGTKPWMGACSAAKRLIEVEFAGDIETAIGFLRWTWARETKRQQWRDANRGGEGGRIGWRLQFASRSLVTDFRIYLARRAKNAGRR